MKDNNYWNTALPALRDALNGIPFDTKNFQGLLVGRSVTEWEVKSAFQSAGVVNGADTMVIPEYLRAKAMWSHRKKHFIHFSLYYNKQMHFSMYRTLGLD